MVNWLTDEGLREKGAREVATCVLNAPFGALSSTERLCCYKAYDQILALLQHQKPLEDRPKIICLCGSTRFVDTFNEWRKTLTLEGCIVLSIELVTTQSAKEDPQHSNHKVKQMLDELHLRKIDLADEVMILNVGGYIGNSTRAEIEYAESKGKPINYLEALNGGK